MPKGTELSFEEYNMMEADNFKDKTEPSFEACGFLPQNCRKDRES